MTLRYQHGTQYAITANGEMIPGSTLNFYLAGTSLGTPEDVFSDAGKTTPISQPIAADAAGRWPDIFMGDEIYDVVWKDAGGSVIKTFLNYDPGLSSALGNGAALPINQGGTGATTAAAALTNLGAASQGQLTTIASTVSDNTSKINTGLNSGTPTRFGLLAPLDTINNANLIDTAVKQTLNPFGLQLVHVRDEQTSGTAGGSYASGAWRQVRLNTSKTNEVSGVALSSNQLTGVPAGTYYLEAHVPFFTANGVSVTAQARLQNITDGSTILLGTNVGSNGSSEQVKYGICPVRGRFTLSGSKTIEVQIQGSQNITGGMAGSFGTEVYASLMIWKIA